MKDTRDHERVHTRKIDRSVAHHLMKERGINHINKHDHYKEVSVTGATRDVIEPSFFAKNWRNYVT